MLNTFPELLTYSQMAPFILRVVIGLIFLDLGLLKFKAEKSRWIASLQALGIGSPEIFVSLLGALEIIGGIMLIIGIYTQVAALGFIILTGLEIYIEYKEAALLKRNIVFYVLLCSIALSLLLTGAGAFAFDIPL
ncbi:MAG: DoxX family membrane protein [Patescibacteria group bacterium]